MAEPSRLTQLARLLDQKARLPDPPYVVALSGGADSAALAAVCADRGELESCLHVHHGYPASDALQHAATEVAQRLGARINSVRVEIATSPASEAAARDARYEAFAASIPDDSRLLVAHTMDDQAETVLLNMIRGAGIRGLAGIPYFRPPNIYRPFLAVSRTETREFAVLRRIPFRDDPMNDDVAIRRNRIRLEILPILEELNPKLREALVRTAGIVGRDSALLDRMAPFERVVVKDETAKVELGVLAVLEPPIRARLIRHLVGSLREGGLALDELERIEEVVSGRSSAAEMEGHIRVTLRGPSLVATKTSK